MEVESISRHGNRVEIAGSVDSFPLSPTPVLHGKTTGLGIVDPTSPTLPQLNPHRARGTDGAHSPAISCLGAFPTPASEPVGWPRHGRRPKTCTNLADARQFMNGGSCEGFRTPGELQGITAKSNESNLSDYPAPISGAKGGTRHERRRRYC